jgi:hypothetical protein
MKLCKMLLVALAATMFLGALVSTSSARTFSTTSQTFRTSFREIRFTLPFGTTSCQLTLEGSLHSRTIAKTVNSLIGYVTRADLGPCASGSVTILREVLPWHVQYRGFTGTLPNITTLRAVVIGWSWRFREPGFVTCLIRSTTTEPVNVTFNREAGGALSSAEIGGSVRTGGECFGQVLTHTSDRGAVTVLNSAARITVTLI